MHEALDIQQHSDEPFDIARKVIDIEMSIFTRIEISIFTGIEMRIFTQIEMSIVT